MHPVDSDLAPALPPGPATAEQGRFLALQLLDLDWTALSPDLRQALVTRLFEATVGREEPSDAAGIDFS